MTARANLRNAPRTGLLLAALTLTAGCGGDQGAAVAVAENTPARGAVPVAVEVLESGRSRDLVKAWAGIQPWREAVLTSGVSGRIARVHVTLGDRVRQGEILLEIDPGLYAARQEEAEARALGASKAREKSEMDLDRSIRMHEQEKISDSELETARVNTYEARAREVAARASLEEARKALADAQLRAPFDGTVARRPPDPGSTVSPGSALTTIVDIERVRVEAQVSERDLASMRLGMEVQVQVESLPGELFAGTVIAIGPQADPESRLFPVEIEVRNPPGHPLKGGMIAGVGVVVETLDDVPLLPLDAIVETRTGRGFYVVENGSARWRAAVFGPRDEDGRIALREGGAPGDSVVILGQARLEDGTPVRLEARP